MYDASSLLDLCIDFCAKNIHFIDCMIGFPEDFAVKIFERAINLKVLASDNDNTKQALRVYSEAGYYREVKFPNLLLINQYELSIQGLMEFTEKLDLTNICLDDHHDLLIQIPECRNIKVLILQSTNLTDKGLKKVTYPCFGAKKLPSLHYLDLSGLQVTSKYLNTLRHLPQLKSVLFYSSDKIPSFLAFRLTQRPNVEKVINGSLVTKLFLHWLKQLSQERKKVLEEKSSASSSFYTSNAAGGRDSAKSFAVKAPKSKAMFERIQEPKTALHATNPLLSTSTNVSRKRSYEPGNCIVGPRKPKQAKLALDVENIEQMLDSCD
eukprot:TRINITY_DN5803_c0_g2_i9.p1 TRINITY_DN5803_c0_g2~~TRINITY_DN5803_c0_g2_i9.p1  ORF type:complete len:334 (+),score=23.68 TRINITY_DN5803_c0_g2_i9:36-1004(+)